MDNLEANRPAYITNKLSNVLERPHHSKHIYSALHGPVANNSDIKWQDFRVVGNWYLNDGNIFRNNVMLNQWKKDNVLYLYHGERYCVKREYEAGADVGLFHDVHDASLMRHPHQDEDYERTTKVATANMLRADLLLADDWQVKTLFARDIV